MSINPLIERLGAIPEDRLVDFLRNLHERKTQGKESTDLENAFVAKGDDVYDRTRELFTKHERTLRRQANLADAVIEELRAQRKETATPSPFEPSRPSQEQIFIRAPLTGMAGGRFRLCNRRNARADLTLRASALRSTRTNEQWTDVIHLAPGYPALDAGEDCIITVSINLSAMALTSVVKSMMVESTAKTPSLTTTIQEY